LVRRSVKGGEEGAGCERGEWSRRSRRDKEREEVAGDEKWGRMRKR